MAETNNKKESLAGIIYHDIKTYLAEKKAERKEIRQRKKAENRKIKFREVFIEKCKKGYHSILAKYYARKEVKIIKQNAELEDVINKKLEHMEKYEEKKEAVDEMERIRAEQKAAKEAEKAQKVAENESVEEVTPVANEVEKEEETKTEEVVPVVEEPKKEETAVAVVYPNPYEMVNNNQAVEETQMTEIEPVVTEQTVEVEIPVAVEPVQVAEETTVVEEPMLDSVSVEDELAKIMPSSPVEETPQVVEVAPVVEEVSQTAETSENNQEMDAEEQAKLAENVQAILESEQNIEQENVNNDLDILKKTEELGASIQLQQDVVVSLATKQKELSASVAQLQQDVAVSLTSKQRELNEVKEENKKLAEERDNAKNENAKNVKVYNSVIVSKDEEIAALRQQLEQERNAKVYIEDQFRTLKAAIQNVQAMGTEQPQVEVVQEESFQKKIN